jgi:hypothetical protein
MIPCLADNIILLLTLDLALYFWNSNREQNSFLAQMFRAHDYYETQVIRLGYSYKF